MTDEEIRALVDEFRQRADADPEIRSVMRKIRNQDADFSDTSRMFWRRSELLRNYLQGVVLDLPAGAREQLCTALLNAGYNETNKVMQSVQQAQDEPQGIHLNPVLPKRPAERIHTVAHALEDPTIPDDKIVRRAGAPVANVQMSFHDRYIEENAKIRAKLGMKPTITRYGSGCCKWCSEVAGRYRFGEQPDGIFRRHDNCNCTIIYDNQVLRGRKTSSGRSRAWEEVKPEDVLAEGFQPKVFSQEEARELQERLMQGLTMPGQGDIIGIKDVKPMINAIEQPIEQQHSGKGNPNAILMFDTPLTNRQSLLLEQLPEYDSRVIVGKDDVNMADLAALTAKTGNEFALFTRKQDRLIIRGNERKVNISVDDAKALAADGYRWSGHTHPGTTLNCLMPSGGDKAVLEQFPQKTSVIYNSKGQYATFEKEE